MYSPEGKGPIWSIAKSSQASAGKWVVRMGSGFWYLLVIWHPWHALQLWSYLLSIPGQNCLVLIACFVPTIQRCPSCASATIFDLNLCSTTILLPRKTSLPITHSSSLILLYNAGPLKFDQFLYFKHLVNWLTSGSASDLPSFSLAVTALGVALRATDFTYARSSNWDLPIHGLDGFINLISGSAMLNSPGMYWIS